MHSYPRNSLIGVKIGAIAIIIGIMILWIGPLAASQEIVVDTVREDGIYELNGKSSNSKNEHLIICENEVFENEDCARLLKFDSTDIVRKLKEGHTYRMKVAGWRIPILSMFRNIISVEEELVND